MFMLTCLSLCTALAVGVPPLPVMAKTPPATGLQARVRDFPYGRLAIQQEDSDFIILEKSGSRGLRPHLPSVSIGSAVRVDAALIDSFEPSIDGGRDAQR
ncbi:hypothetical protein [Sphingobium sp. YR657]|uniref:hypothetical protein n=1 Tax=Sphingobium sp. YR657 TaxID=1884366 RepID=UPI001114F577|nr:hypothetical protein [Sphingobium sp. YR657]